MQNQKEAGVFTTVAMLVDQFSDNPAAKMTAMERLIRLYEAWPKPEKLTEWRQNLEASEQSLTAKQHPKQ